MEFLSSGLWELLIFLSLFCITDAHSCNERNMTAPRGGSVTFVCCTNLPSPVGWRYKQQEGSLPSDIVEEGSVVNEQYGSRVTPSANVSAGIYSMTLHNITVNDSGLYICGENKFAGENHYYLLTVYNASESEITSGSNALIAGIIVVVGIVIVVSIAVFVYLYIRRKKLCDPSKRLSARETETPGASHEMTPLTSTQASNQTGIASGESGDVIADRANDNHGPTTVAIQASDGDSPPPTDRESASQTGGASGEADNTTTRDILVGAHASPPQSGDFVNCQSRSGGVSDSERSARAQEDEQATNRTDTTLTPICETIKKYISKLITCVDCSSPEFRTRLSTFSTPTSETDFNILSDNPNVDCYVLELLKDMGTNEENCEEFLRVLNSTGQAHVAKFIESARIIGVPLNNQQSTNQPAVSTTGSCGDCEDGRPLSRDEQNRLDVNRTKLAKLIVLDDQFLERLRKEKCLMDWQKNQISSIADGEKKWREFIYILKRRSDKHLDTFVAQIEEEKVRGLITRKQVAVETDIQLLETSIIVSVKDVVKSIEEYFASVNKNNSKIHKPSALEDLAQRCDNDEVSVVARPQKGVGIFFLCGSLDVLSLLLTLYSSGQLQSILDIVFRRMLNSEMKVLKNVVFDPEYSIYRSFFRREPGFEEELECKLMEKNCRMSFNEWLKKRETDWRDVIRKQFAALPREIKAGTELYNHLTVICDKWWTKRLAEYVTSKGSNYDQVTELLTSLRTRPVDDFIGFCEALYKSRQTHIVVELLTPEISKPEKSKPIKAPDTVTAASSETTIDFNWKNLIRSNYMELLATIDPDNGLLPNLLTKNVITDYNMEHFQAPLKKNRRLRVDALLQYMLRRPDKDFDILRKALENTKQEFIVKTYLTPGESVRKTDGVQTWQSRGDLDDMQEVSEWRDLLRRNRVELLDKLVATETVLTGLHEFGVLNDYTYEHLREIGEGDNTTRNEQLLDYMSRRPPVDFSRFRVVLISSGQEHIVHDYLT